LSKSRSAVGAKPIPKNKKSSAYKKFREEVLADFRLANESRVASLIGRREVLTGKAKFGIFGDGKEVAQLAMAKAFQNGDFRAGYYRDQTFMFATGTLTLEQFFSQLYADPEITNDPHSAGRQMNAHFGSRTLNEDGSWKNLVERKNSAADCSPTASQMARSVGLALASKHYRQDENLHSMATFSDKGNEVTFCTIGDASCAEGVFWESINAAGVMKIPLAVSIWDDGYGISVPQKYQITKQDLGTLLEGFNANKTGEGLHIERLKGWDYPTLCEAYAKGITRIRKTHVPTVFVVGEITQPQGHSTSGSHERYKSKSRLQWETDFDCITRMRSWIISKELATAEELDEIERLSKETVNEAKRSAIEKHRTPIRAEIEELGTLLEKISTESQHPEKLLGIRKGLLAAVEPLRRDVMKAAKTALRLQHKEETPSRQELIDWKNRYKNINQTRYSSHLYSESTESALHVREVPPVYSEESRTVLGFEVLNHCFDEALKRDPRIVAFGEDVGHLGGVNQAFSGLQKKHGELRVFDTGIRENTIMGQGIGLAMRGLRPIAEIQYLDYLIYGLQPLTDDLATLQYRTKGGQKAPLIIRTRGHRLEGIWHTGSPMGMILHSLRGIHVLVPRNMTQAAGMYNTLLQSDDPGLLIECLNGYRIKEKLPDNVGEFTVPLGIPEILQEGTDITIVTYGSCVRIAQEAVRALNEVGVSCELIDVQTLLPFDREHRIVESLKKTSRIIFFDEDVPGGGTGFMMHQVLEQQEGYHWLDSMPVTVTAREHRAAYGSDGDYFSKPNAEDLFEAAFGLMHEFDPARYPRFY